MESAFLLLVPIATTASPAAPLATRLVIVAIFLVILIAALAGAALLRRTPQSRALSSGSGRPTPDEAKATLALVGDTAPIYVIRYADDGCLLSACSGTPRLFGEATDRARADGRALLDAVHPDDRSTWLAAFAARTGTSRDPIELQFRVRAPDGSWRWLHERVRAVAIVGGTREWESVAVDFSDRRAAVDQQHRIFELQRLSTRILESFLHSDDHEATVRSTLAIVGEAFGVARASLASVDTAASTATVLYEWRQGNVPSATERRQSQSPPKIAWWISAARAGQPSTFRRDGSEAGPPSTTSSINAEVQAMLVVPILVHSVLRAAIVLEDLQSPRRFRREEITAAQTLAFAIARGMEQRESGEERTHLHELQRQLERSELVAQLAGGVARDFNNLLFAVGGQVHILRQKTNDPAMQSSLDGIERALAGAAGMVAAIQRAHRGEVEAPSVLALASELELASRLAARLLPRAIEFETDLTALADARVVAAPQGLRQITLNLVLNARDAIGERGHIRVAGRIVDDVALGRCAEITVDDDGPGIAPELRERVLAPYFTTKGLAGTGLGLSICQRVVKDAGGRFTLETSPSLGGLRVTSTIPLASEAETSEAPLGTASKPTELAAPSAVSAAIDSLADLSLVLVVEDNHAVRRILAHTFAAYDIDVVERSDANDVESDVLDSPLRFDLVVMDVDLPGMSGMECARRLRARGSLIPILFVTGGTTELDAALAPATLLRKPFPIEALTAASHDLIAKNRLGVLQRANQVRSEAALADPAVE